MVGRGAGAGRGVKLKMYSTIFDWRRKIEKKHRLKRLKAVPKNRNLDQNVNDSKSHICYFRDTGGLFLGCALFVACCNFIRPLWETKKEERLSYRNKVHWRICVTNITCLNSHPSFSVILVAFFVYSPSQVTYLMNGPNKDTYCYAWYSVWYQKYQNLLAV